MEHLCETCNTYKPQEFFVSINGKINNCKKCLGKKEKYEHSVNYDSSLIRKIKNIKTK